jgi:hypothetical protein
MKGCGSSAPEFAHGGFCAAFARPWPVEHGTSSRAGDTWDVTRPPVLPPFIAGVLAATTLAITGCGGGDGASQSDRDKAVAEAQAAFRQVQASGRDLNIGPCISESLPGLADWVADIAHDPRESVDDDPANQCRRYRAGDAHHFVELNVDGQLIRAE